jgi:hypothetical protein
MKPRVMRLFHFAGVSISKLSQHPDRKEWHEWWGWMSLGSVVVATTARRIASSFNRETPSNKRRAHASSTPEHMRVPSSEKSLPLRSRPNEAPAAFASRDENFRWENRRRITRGASSRREPALVYAMVSVSHCTWHDTLCESLVT